MPDKKRKKSGARVFRSRAGLGRHAAKSLGKGIDPRTGKPITNNAEGVAMGKEAARHMVVGTIQDNRKAQTSVERKARVDARNDRNRKKNRRRM